jgi:hypothetical protein
MNASERRASGTPTGFRIRRSEHSITLMTGIFILDVYTRLRLPRQETIVMAKKAASKKKAKKKAKKKR